MTKMTDNNNDLFLQELQSSRNSLSFKDFLYLCLGRWWWFAISVVLVLGVAAVYILRTPPAKPPPDTLPLLAALPI